MHGPFPGLRRIYIRIRRQLSTLPRKEPIPPLNIFVILRNILHYYLCYVTYGQHQPSTEATEPLLSHAAHTMGSNESPTA